MNVRQVNVFDEIIDADPVGVEDVAVPNDPYFDTPPSMTRRVSSRQSPHLSCFYQHFPTLICIDTGAESNLISEAFGRKVGIPIKPTTHMAAQADGQSMLRTVGETRNVQLLRGAHVFTFDALIVRDLGSYIIIGEPFLEKHDIGVRSARKQITIKGRDIISYAQHDSPSSPITRRIFTFLYRAPSSSTTILSREYISVAAPGSYPDNDTVVIEPRADSHSPSAGIWPKIQLTSVIGGQIHVPNKGNEPILLKKSDHFCQIRMTTMISSSDPPQLFQASQLPSPSPLHPPPSAFYSDAVIIDPQNQLSSDWHDKFTCLHQQFDALFHPSVGCYNDASGRVRARVNLGPVIPPTKKLHVPNYSQSNLQLLQARFDELEAQGVFARPEDVNVIVEYVSPSFLVRKSSGGYRLVTAFSTLDQYSRTLPTIMPSVNDTLRSISSWKYLITTDLRDSFYQITLDKASMKWCATPTPFRGLRVYLRSAQGMPGSSETLKELMSTVLGYLVQQGRVAKIADDLYVGGNTVAELYSNWADVLQILLSNGFHLNASKTKFAPVYTSLLGWIWNNGAISLGAHKISPLATCAPSITVTALRSFICSFNVLNRVLRGCSHYLTSLEAEISGKQKRDKIVWSEPLLNSFHAAPSGYSDFASTK